MPVRIRGVGPGTVYLQAISYDPTLPQLFAFSDAVAIELRP